MPLISDPITGLASEIVPQPEKHCKPFSFEGEVFSIDATSRRHIRGAQKAAADDLTEGSRPLRTRAIRKANRRLNRWEAVPLCWP